MSLRSKRSSIVSNLEGRENPAFEHDSIEVEKSKKDKKKKKNDVDLDTQFDTGTPWSEMTGVEKTKRVFINTGKVVLVLGLLYFFVCSLDLLSSAFRLVAGKSTTDVLENEFIQNPVVGLMIGILVTVLVQSSSTSTSIIVSMVAASILDVRTAIPMVMGANIGTSVTNTIVSLTQVGNREEFRRAFAGATIHDMFNWLNVIVLLTLEILTHMLEKLTHAILSAYNWENSDVGEIKLLKVITEPFTDLIVQLDSNVLLGWGTGDPNYVNTTSLVKEFCEYELANDTLDNGTLVEIEVGVPDSCDFLFYNTNMSDQAIGAILLIMSLTILCGALILIVKVLNSVLKGQVALIIKKTLNANIPYVPWLTGYIAIVVGAILTFLVQSSSIFTSSITPLIGLGVISLERAYPLCLGSNLGTTTTGLLGAMASGTGRDLEYAIQIALVHTFFNLFGILIYYPIPFMRFPIPLSRKLGNITAKYRWFAIVYLILMFFLLPGFIFLLSLGGTLTMWIVGFPLLILFIIVVLINVLQTKKPNWLPKILRDWDFLPKAMHSLQPYDNCMLSLPCCKKCREMNENEREKLESVSDVEVIVEKNNNGELELEERSRASSSSSSGVEIEKF